MPVCRTGTAPNEKTEMRYPTRASELVHRRLQVLSSPLHDPPRSPTSRQYAGREIIARVVLDLGHQSHVSGLLVQPLFTTAGPDVVREVGPDQLHGLDTGASRSPGTPDELFDKPVSASGKRR